jgi:hypothetical protein
MTFLWLRDNALGDEPYEGLPIFGVIPPGAERWPVGALLTFASKRLKLSTSS